MTLSKPFVMQAPLRFR